jgi:Skp family chaperone for outer membrane proteins
VKKITICLAALGALVCGSLAQAQQPVAPAPAPAPAPAAARPRIALVNIAKVLREYQKANYDGQMLTKKRQEYVDKIKPMQERIATINKLVQVTQVPEQRAALQREGVELQRRSEDLDREAKTVLTEITDRTIVEVYQNIKSVITDIAVTNNLDLVMCYPDASTAEEDKKPTVAQIKLQTPALIPMYHRGMDITDVVVVTLNRRHPAPAAPVATAPGAPSAPPAPPTPGITPTGGAVPPPPR